MRRFVLCLVVLGLFSAQSFAAIIESSNIENDGTWTVEPTFIPFLPSGTSGIVATAGSEYFHFNSSLTSTTGTNTIGFASLLGVGTYQATIDVGNFNNRFFPLSITVGMTAGGTLLTPSLSSTPAPALGAINTWVLDYTIGAGNALLGQNIGFEITGQDRNVSFDNLNIHSPSPIPEPLINLQ